MSKLEAEINHLKRQLEVSRVLTVDASCVESISRALSQRDDTAPLTQRIQCEKQQDEEFERFLAFLLSHVFQK